MLAFRCFRVAVCAALLLGSIPAQAGKVDLVSRRDPGSVAPELIGDADSAALSSDGRWAAFTSSALNLVPGQNDANNGTDVFLLDRQSGTITLVSHSALSAVTTGTLPSSSPAISADGRYVAFMSAAGNLIAGQTGGDFYYQVLVYDRDTGTIALVSHKAGSTFLPASSNSSWPAVSRDGSSIAFMSEATDLVTGVSDTNNVSDVYVYEVATGALSLISYTASSTTTTGAGSSSYPKVGADGRYVLFDSWAPDLASGQTDTNSNPDVFLHDRVTGTTVLVSRAAGTSTTAANASSGSGSLSDDGAYVVFSSYATNLVTGQTDTASTYDLFLFDRSTGTVTLVTHADGAPATAVGGYGDLSADGAWVVFTSDAANVVPGQADTNGGGDVFLWQRSTGTTTLVSHADGSATTTGAGTSFRYRLSDDGRYLLFGSTATNLVSGQTDANGVADAFLYDRAGGTTVLVSHVHGSSTAAGNGTLSAANLSADGAWAAFASTASDLTSAVDPGNRDLFLYERASGTNLSFTYGETLSRLTPTFFSSIGLQATSQDGRYVAMAGFATDLVPGQVDPDPTSVDAFLVDRLTGTATLLSHAAGSPATAANDSSWYPVISADGAWIAFESYATDLMPGIGTSPPFPANVFLYNRDAGTLTLVSRRASNPGLSGSGPSLYPAMSADGRYVAFTSAAWNLVTGQVDPANTGDTFLYDRVTGGMSLVSHKAGDPLQAANGDSTPYNPVVITPDGRWVLFSSRGTDLVAGQTDTNNGEDLFLYDRTTAAVVLVSRAASSPSTAGNVATVMSRSPVISPDGRYVAFASSATDLVAGQVDTNGEDDLFLFDRLSGTVTLISHPSGSPATAGSDESKLPFFSEDGLYLMFASLSTDLLPGQSGLRRYDPFLYELSTGTLSLLPGGATPQQFVSTFPLGATAGARTVLLWSGAMDMIDGQVDVNGGSGDLFLLDRTTGARKLISRTPASPLTTGNRYSNLGILRAGGNLVLFTSAASDLVPGDFNTVVDVFAYTAGAAPASDFYTVPPCRALDTRSGSPLSSGVTGYATLHGVCGVPDTAVAVAVNLTVIGATGSGNLKVYPGDIAPPAASSLNFQAGVTRANNAILPLSDDGSGTLGLLASVAGDGTVHVAVDVVGYFQ